jgi:hypothetical protein
VNCVFPHRSLLSPGGQWGSDFWRRTLYTRINYGADAAVTAEVTPPPAQPIAAATAAQMHGTIDQLTAYLVLGATPRPTRLVFAQLLPGDLVIPVRMEFASEFGTFTAELAELRGRGADLQLAE